MTLPFDWLIGGPAPLSGGGVYEAPFKSGSIQVLGPNNSITGYGAFQFGFALPNASGIPSEGMLIGGAGQPQVVILTDEQLPGQKGITMIIEAGDASPFDGANQDGGDLLDFAGGTINGTGGTRKVQAGTSVNGRGGATIVQGGDSTNGIPGDVFIEGGVNGSQGANVQLIATGLGTPITYGVIRHRFNSIFTMDEFENGAWYLYKGGGYGLAGQPIVSGGPNGPVSYQVGYTGSFPVTGGIANYQSGILVSVT